MRSRIVVWDSPILSQPMQLVTKVNRSRAEEVAQNLVDTLTEEAAYGLASPQIGENFSIIAINTKELPALPAIMINPFVEELTGDVVFNEEGCLSLPGMRQQVGRYSQVRVSWEGLDGVNQESLFSDILAARVLQHEIDHVNGIMFFQHLSRQMRRSLLRDWEKERQKGPRR